VAPGLTTHVRSVDCSTMMREAGLGWFWARRHDAGGLSLPTACAFCRMGTCDAPIENAEEWRGTHRRYIAREHPPVRKCPQAWHTTCCASASERVLTAVTGPCGLGSTRPTTQVAPEPVRAVNAQRAGLRSLREHPDHHAEREPGPCAHAQAAARIPWPYVKHEALRSSSSSRLLKEDLTFG
jgi:hypothetical protein